MVTNEWLRQVSCIHTLPAATIVLYYNICIFARVNLEDIMGWIAIELHHALLYYYMSAGII